MKNKEKIHVCNACETKHATSDEKNRVPHPECDGVELLVCKSCGHDAFYVEDKEIEKE